MSYIAILILRAATPAFGILLGLLGFATLDANLLGWLLLVAGVAYAAGSVIVSFVLKRNIWESQPLGAGGRLGLRDRSYWLLTVGLIIVLCLPPLEFLYLRAEALHLDLLEVAGVCLSVLGIALFAWARRSPVGPDEQHDAVAEGQRFGRSVPYRMIRHPAYAGLLLVGGGLSLGYGSRLGFLSLLLLLLPVVLWRIRVDERQLVARFGQRYAEYASRTKRLIPWVW